MSTPLEYNKTPGQTSVVLQSKQMDLDAGWLGRCFGSVKNAPLNIAGFVVVVLIVAGTATLFFQSLVPASEFWKIITPLVTLVMGFVFGRGSKD